MRLKCAAAIWLLADPCKQTNRTVGVFDEPAPAVAGLARVRQKNLPMEPTSCPKFSSDVDRLERERPQSIYSLAGQTFPHGNPDASRPRVRRRQALLADPP